VSEHPLRTNVKSLPIQAVIPWLVGESIYMLLISLGSGLLNDADTYWQIAVGRWIFDHGAVPRVDPFSFTFPGAPWIAFEWLSELIYAATFSLSSWIGVAALAAFAIALAFSLLARFLLRELAPIPALILILAAVVLTAPHMLARPHVLVFPIMVAWAAALVRTTDEGSNPPYAALPLLILWANLHGSVIVGIGLIGPAILEKLLQAKKRSEWIQIILHWIPFTVLAISASCLTPYGINSLLIPLKTLGLGNALNRITEWRPQNFDHLGAFEIFLLLGIFALSRGIRLPLVRTLVVLGLLHFALAHIRNADLLAMLVPIYLAHPLSQQIKSRPEKLSGPLPPAYGIGAVVTIIAILATGLSAIRTISPAMNNRPQAAIAAADLAKSGPILNDYSFGGYLIFSGIAPFIDGRGELYGAHFIERYSRATSLADLPDFIKILDEYKIRSTLLTPTTPAVAMLDRLPNWQRVYSDEVAVVHKRRGTVPK
jgi:hypothetical protein